VDIREHGPWPRERGQALWLPLEPVVRCKGGRLFFCETKPVAGVNQSAMLDLRIDDRLARLTLRRPEARNAIPAADWARLAALADDVARSGARALIVAGEGPSFCAGADLADFETMDMGARSAFRIDMRKAFATLAALPIPTIAAIHGPCFGAGVALAMACDLRIAGPAASFAITPAKFGISYPQEDIARLAALVGPGQAARLLLGAGAIDGAEAARIGLVEILADDAGAQAEALAAAMIGGSRASHAALKRGLALAARGVAQDDAQDRSFDDLLGSAELAASLARRKAAR
jgi:enoyl-CoA hydratase/carnithine racemase